MKIEVLGSQSRDGETHGKQSHNALTPRPNNERIMFKKDYQREIHGADLVTVRANKNNLQWCITKVDKKTGGYTILNEGTIPVGKVLQLFLTPNPRKRK